MRDKRFDIIKAILIILVVFGHTTRIGTASGEIEKIIRLVYIFHVSLFFFLSGYFLSIEKLSLQRISRNLLLPYFYTALVYYAAGWMFSGIRPSLWQWFYSAISRTVGGASWFLCALIWMNLIVLIFKKTKTNFRRCLIATSLSIICFKLVVTTYDTQYFFAGEISFLLGLLFHGRKIGEILQRSSPISAILFISLAICKIREMNFVEAPLVLWMIRVSALSTLFGVAVFVKHFPRLEQCLVYIGKSTLIIFLIHSLWNRCWLPILTKALSFDKSGIIFMFVNTFVVIVSCLCVKSCLNYFRSSIKTYRTRS